MRPKPRTNHANTRTAEYGWSATGDCVTRLHDWDASRRKTLQAEVARRRAEAAASDAAFSYRPRTNIARADDAATDSAGRAREQARAMEKLHGEASRQARATEALRERSIDRRRSARSRA